LAPLTSGRLVVDAGYFSRSRAGRIGLGANVPPQFGQTPWSGPLAHCAQNVHSNEQITASAASGARSLPQHSQ